MYFKKIIYFLLILIILFSFNTPTFANVYQENLNRYFAVDVDENHWAYEELDSFLAADIISGYEDKNGDVHIDPNANITRAQFAKIIVNTLDLQQNEDSATKEFPDVSPNDWFYPYVQKAYSHGIVTGTVDGTFRPNDLITRDQISVMIARSMPILAQLITYRTSKFSDIPNTYWAHKEISLLNRLEIVSGYGNLFKPRAKATRAQAIVMLHRALYKDPADGENTNEIHQMLTDYFEAESKIFEENSFELLSPLDEQYTTGYYRAYANYLTSNWQNVKKNGVHIPFTISRDYTQGYPGGKSIWKRIGWVEIRGLNYRYTMDGKTYETTADGFYYVKKNSDGKWRIFNYYPAE